MRNRILVGAMTAALLGCGGGAPELSDETPPTVVSTSPEEGATQVRVSEPIVVRFSEPIRPGFTATLHAGEDVLSLAADAVTLVDDAREVRIAPPRGLVLPQAMRLVVTGVVDRFDNPLAGGDVDLHFEYPAWLSMGKTECGSAAVFYAAAGSTLYTASATCANRWTGSIWERLPDSGTGTAATRYAIDGEGALAVCAVPASGGGAPVVKRFVQDSWSTLPTLPRPAVSQCALAAVDGVLHAAVRWLAGTEQWHRVYRLTGSAWHPVGDEVVTLDEGALSVHGAGGALTLATGSALYALSEDQTAWSLLPSPGTWSEVGQSSVGPVVAGGGTVRQYAAGTWTTLGVTSEVRGLFATPGAQPLIVKSTGADEYAGFYRQVLEWDGLAWRALGPEVLAGPVPDRLGADSGGRVFFRYYTNVFQYNR